MKYFHSYLHVIYIYLLLFCFVKVDTYEKIYTEVEALDNTVIFEKWFRVDSRPFKQALLNIIKRWSFMFKQHLIDHVTNR